MSRRASAIRALEDAQITTFMSNLVIELSLINRCHRSSSLSRVRISLPMAYSMGADLVMSTGLLIFTALS